MALYILHTIFTLFLSTQFHNCLCDENLESYYQRDHSLVRPYQGTGMVIPNWEFYGTTMVTSQYVRLTPDVQSTLGGLYNKMPLNFRNWEVFLEFRIGSKNKDLFGDGMAFWLTKDPLGPGPVFGAKDYFFGLAIFFDTYANQNGAHSHQHPYISAMINNGTLHYDHDRDGTHTELAGCEAKLRNIEHNALASIKYENDVLSMKTDFESTGEWNECFTVRGVILPTGYHIGVSAATGELSDNHDIISIKTVMIPSSAPDSEDRRNILPSASHFAAPRTRVEDKHSSMSSLKFFLLIVFGLIAVVFIGAIGYLVFQKHQETSRKRFY